MATMKTAQEAIKDRFTTIYDYLNGYFEDIGVSVIQEELVLAIDNAWRAICKYCWIDYDLEDITEYLTPITMLSKAYYQNAIVQKKTISGNTPITQLTQGSRSVTYKNSTVDLDGDGMTAQVKACLPSRKMRVLG